MFVMDSKSIMEKGNFVDLESGRSESDDVVDCLDNSSKCTENPFNNEREKTRRKPSKPPRPPKSPPLLTGDQRLAQEISEYAMLKRARVERMKAFKNKKKVKSVSSNANFCALVITIIFCAIIIWQVGFSRSRSRERFHGSSESSHESLVEFHRNLSTDPLPSSFIKQASMMIGERNAGRASY